MSKINKRVALLPLVFALLLLITSVLAVNANAADKNTYNEAMLSQIKVPHKVKSRYESIKVGADGKVLDSRLINETTYAPVRAFYDALGDFTVTYYSRTRTLSVNNRSFSFSATDGAYYLMANGRYLWTDNPIVILDDGRMYAPVRLLAKTLGVDVAWDNSTRSVALKGAVKYIESGDTFYKKDDVYWLSRIISAESRGEPMLGQISVGNVVLNRVRSKQYPNTIYGVIFDRKYGTQFSPVSNGSIYNTPTAQSVISAKLCLEGASLSEDILFFYNSRIATTNWIGRARPFAFGIGNHKFYY